MPISTVYTHDEALLMITVMLLCTEEPCVFQNVYAELDVGVVFGFLAQEHICALHLSSRVCYVRHANWSPVNGADDT